MTAVKMEAATAAENAAAKLRGGVCATTVVVLVMTAMAVAAVAAEAAIVAATATS
eukprot:SAG22_NODE_2627_length_2361_cov_1.664456_2_plen_55_part_00